MADRWVRIEADGDKTGLAQSNMHPKHPSQTKASQASFPNKGIPSILLKQRLPKHSSQTKASQASFSNKGNVGETRGREVMARILRHFLFGPYFKTIGHTFHQHLKGPFAVPLSKAETFLLSFCKENSVNLRCKWIRFSHVQQSRLAGNMMPGVEFFAANLSFLLTAQRGDGWPYLAIIILIYINILLQVKISNFLYVWCTFVVKGSCQIG